MWWLNSTIIGALGAISIDSFKKSYASGKSEQSGGMFNDILWTGKFWVNFGSDFIDYAKYTSVENRSTIWTGIRTTNLFSFLFFNDKTTKSGKTLVEFDITDFDSSPNTAKTKNKFELTHTDTINKICQLTPLTFSAIVWFGAYYCGHQNSNDGYTAMEAGCIASIIVNLILECLDEEKHTLDIKCDESELVLVSEFEDASGNILSNYSDVDEIIINI